MPQYNDCRRHFIQFLSDRESNFWHCTIFSGKRTCACVCCLACKDHFALRPQKWSGLLGTGGGGGRGGGGEGGGDERVKARPRIPPEKDRGPPPEQWTEVLRWCPLAIVQRLVHCAVTVLTAVLRQSHKDNAVRCTAVDEQLEAKEVQLSQPSSTSLLRHDLFWAKLKVQLHLRPLLLISHLSISPGPCGM